jgi:YggT family protein
VTAAVQVAGAVLLLFQLLLLARVVLDWSTLLAGPALAGSVRGRLSAGVTRLTEPVLGRVRRVLPPLRLGSIALDIAFIAVFLGVSVLRQVLLSHWG